jgi:hypothetical protein
MVFSGNVDGSVTVWDLREPFSLHLSSTKKREFRSEETVVRSATYSTAGVLLGENHSSEVKAVLALQNRSKDYEKTVFLQLATLELESKLIIWVNALEQSILNEHKYTINTLEYTQFLQIILMGLCL